MIKSFADKATEAIFHGERPHGIHKNFTAILIKAAERKLDLLNSAENWDSLSHIPSMQGEGVVRDGKGKYSIPIYESYRLTFRWNGGNAEDVEIKH